MQAPTKNAILKFLGDYGNDGWSILRPDALTKHYKFPASWAKPLIRNHASGEGKFAITDNSGKPVRRLEGIHTLSILSKLASQLGAECESKLGRGSQASAYTAGIRKALNS